MVKPPHDTSFSRKGLFSRLRRSSRDKSADENLHELPPLLVGQREDTYSDEAPLNNKNFGDQNGAYLELVPSIRPPKKTGQHTILRCEFTMVDVDNGRTWSLRKSVRLTERARSNAQQLYPHLPEYDGLAKLFFGFDRVFKVDGKFVLADDYWNYTEPLTGKRLPKVYGTYWDRTKPMQAMWGGPLPVFSGKPYEGRAFDLPYHEKFGGRVGYAGTITGRFTSADKKLAQPPRSHHMPEYYGIDFATGPDETVHVEMQMPGLHGEPLSVRRISAVEYHKANQMPLSEEEAAALRERYFSIYPALEEWSNYMTQTYVPNPRDMDEIHSYDFKVADDGVLYGKVDAKNTAGRIIRQGPVCATKDEQDTLRASGILSDHDILVSVFMTQWEEAYKQQTAENNFKADLLAERAAKRAPDLSDAVVVGGEDFFALLSFHCIDEDKGGMGGNSYTFRLPGKMAQPSGAINNTIEIGISDAEFERLGISNNLHERTVYARDRAMMLWDMRLITSTYGRTVRPEVMGRNVIKIHDTLFIWYKRNGDLGGACTHLDEALDLSGRTTPLRKEEEIPAPSLDDLDDFLFQLVRDLVYAMDDGEERNDLYEKEGTRDGYETVHVVTDEHWQKLSSYLDKLDGLPVVDHEHPDDLLGAAAKLAVLLKIRRTV